MRVGEHTGAGAAQPLTGVAGVLQQVPDGFQEHPFLGVDVLGLELRHTEEQRVEAVGAADETAPFPVGLAGDGPVRVVEPAVVPAVARYLLDAVPAGP